MRPRAIKRAVEQAKEKHIKEAINDVARSAAYEEVHRAIHPPPPVDENAEEQPLARAPDSSDVRPTYQVFQPGDPRLSRC